MYSFLFNLCDGCEENPNETRLIFCSWINYSNREKEKNLKTVTFQWMTIVYKNVYWSKLLVTSLPKYENTIKVKAV